jgi:hypothetical protein
VSKLERRSEKEGDGKQGKEENGSIAEGDGLDHVGMHPTLFTGRYLFNEVCVRVKDLPTEKFSRKNRGLPRYSPPRYQPVNLHRNSQTVNEVFKNRLKPRNARTAGFAGFQKPDRRSDYCGADEPM